MTVVNHSTLLNVGMTLTCEARVIRLLKGLLRLTDFLIPISRIARRIRLTLRLNTDIPMETETRNPLDDCRSLLSGKRGPHEVLRPSPGPTFEELNCCKKKKREEVKLSCQSRWQGAFISLARCRPQMGLTMDFGRCSYSGKLKHSVKRRD